MKIADKTLRYLEENDIYVNVLTDHYDDSFFGFIKKFSKDFLILEHYSHDGFYNGILIFKRHDITRLKWNNNEMKSASLILARREHMDEIQTINLESIESIVKSVDKAFGYVSIQIQDINPDWTIIGQVKDIDEETLVIKEFGTPSTLDRGMLMISNQDITRVDAGGIYEQNLMKIHKNNN